MNTGAWAAVGITRMDLNDRRDTIKESIQSLQDMKFQPGYTLKEKLIANATLQAWSEWIAKHDSEAVFPNKGISNMIRNQGMAKHNTLTGNIVEDVMQRFNVVAPGFSYSEAKEWVDNRTQEICTPGANQTIDTQEDTLNTWATVGQMDEHGM